MKKVTLLSFIVFGILMSFAQQKTDATPTITAEPEGGNYSMGSVYGGDTYTKVVNIKAVGLTSDITVSMGVEDEDTHEITPTGELALSTTVITRAQAESADGFDLTVTLTPTDEYMWEEYVYLASEGVDTVSLHFIWMASMPTAMADLATLKAEVDKDDFSSWNLYRYTGEAVVSHVYKDNGDKTWIYMQDETAGIAIQDAFGDLTHTYVVGDKIGNVICGLEIASGQTFMLPSTDIAPALSQENEVPVAELTIAELVAGGMDYDGKLVKLSDVHFTNAGGVFGNDDNKSDTPLTQGDDEAALAYFEGADYMGNVIPQVANVMGIAKVSIVWGEAFVEILPRNLADIADASSLEDGVANDVQVVCGSTGVQVFGAEKSIRVYGVSGQVVYENLQPNGLVDILTLKEGVYVVVVDGMSQKVILTDLN